MFTKTPPDEIRQDNEGRYWLVLDGRYLPFGNEPRLAIAAWLEVLGGRSAGLEYVHVDPPKELVR